MVEIFARMDGWGEGKKKEGRVAVLSLCVGLTDYEVGARWRGPDLGPGFLRLVCELWMGMENPREYKRSPGLRLELCELGRTSTQDLQDLGR